MAKGSEIGGVNEKRVKELITEALNGRIDEKQVKVLIVEIAEELRGDIVEAVKGLLTEARAVELIKEGLKTVPDEARVIELAEEIFFPDTGSGAEEEQLDPAWLTGLTFTSSQRVPKRGERDVHECVKRDLEPDDVLSFRLTDEHVYLVAADGQRHKVAR